jgi:hypothetical protein
VLLLFFAPRWVLVWLSFLRAPFVCCRVNSPEKTSASPGDSESILGISRSRHVVAKLASLFALDSFAGGFVVQSFAAYWFYLRFGVNPATLGVIFFWANIFAESRHYCVAPCFSLRPYQHHGYHAPPLEHSADSCATDAES